MAIEFENRGSSSTKPSYGEDPITDSLQIGEEIELAQASDDIRPVDAAPTQTPSTQAATPDLPPTGGTLAACRCDPGDRPDVPADDSRAGTYGGRPRHGRIEARRRGDVHRRRHRLPRTLRVKEEPRWGPGP